MVKTALILLAATATTADAGECYCSCCNWCHMSECYDGHSCCDDPTCSGCGHELEDETPEWVKTARAAAALQAKASCSGSDDPTITSDTCYTGSAGALGLKETVTVTIHDFANAKGHVDIVGSGIQDISCKGKEVSKTGQDLTTDLSDCLPSDVTITSLKYCSDSDTITVTVKDKSVPLPVSATLKKTDCASVSNGVDEMWNEFKSAHAVNGDEAERKAIFAKNVKKAVEHNRKATGSWMGVQGPFAAMTLEEFQAANIRGFVPAKSQGLPNLGTDESPASAAAIDWTTKGAVTPVKNQGQCGSCWAFSTTGGLEGAWQLSSGNLVSMSEQQFVDCDKVDSGCNGGLMDNAFGWAENQAIATEASYAYTGRDGSCKSSFSTAIPSGGVTGYKDVSNSGSALTSALQNSPISVAIEADQSAFQMYSGGVISSGCGSNLDHGVLAVGVNDDGSIKVKNSWGASWGVNGYVNIATSQCGITTSASYPVVSSSLQVEAAAAVEAEVEGNDCYCSCCNWCHMANCYDGVHCCSGDCSTCGTLEDEVDTPAWVLEARAAAASVAV